MSSTSSNASSPSPNCSLLPVSQTAFWANFLLLWEYFTSHALKSGCARAGLGSQGKLRAGGGTDKSEVHRLNRPIRQAQSQVLHPLSGPGMVSALSLSFWLEEASAVEELLLCLGETDTKSSPHPPEEVGSWFQASREPVTGFMLMKPSPSLQAAYYPGQPTA